MAPATAEPDRGLVLRETAPAPDRPTAPARSACAAGRPRPHGGRTVTGSAGPRRWLAARVAHPVRDLARSAAFYRDLLGLPPRGGFRGHDGYDGTFFALPGGGELELTAGSAAPCPGTDEDLLVLYLRPPEEVQQIAAELESTGVATVPAETPTGTGGA